MHNFTATAAELRQQEFARLSAAVTPRIDEFRNEVAQMLERLGHTLITAARDIITTKEGHKFITAWATPSDRDPTKAPALRRLHEAVVAASAARLLSFTPEAKHYAASAPLDLVDGAMLMCSMHRSRKGMLIPQTYKPDIAINDKKSLTAKPDSCQTP